MTIANPSLRRERLISRFIPPALIFLAIMTLWQGAVWMFSIPRWLLPAPADVVRRFFLTDNLLYHTSMTVLTAGTGFLISAVLAIVLASAIVHSRFLERGLLPYIIVANAIPIIAIIPLLTIWFGFGMAPRVMICTIITFFPIVTNTTQGMKSADPRALEFMRSINATRLQVLWKVQLPSAVPSIFAGFKIAASLSLVGAVVAEFYSSDRGLGNLVITAATQLRTDLLFVAVTILAFLGVTAFFIFAWLEKRALRGQQQSDRA